jgi:hypothetical protein
VLSSTRRLSTQGQLAVIALKNSVRAQKPGSRSKTRLALKNPLRGQKLGSGGQAAEC